MTTPLTRHGRPHWKCGTTLKYVSSGNCYHCAGGRDRSKAADVSLLDKLDAALLDFPRRSVRIERRCRLPLVVEIPAPPVTVVNRAWG